MNKQERVERSFDKMCQKYLRKISMKQYIDTCEQYQYTTISEGKTLTLTSPYYTNVLIRHKIVETLKDIGYVRTGKWTEKTAIGFLDEVLQLYTSDKDKYIISEIEEQIAIRYNVDKNRLKTQAALFLMNHQRGKDAFKISKYFSPYELVSWRYRDINKLQQDIESDELNAYDKYLLEQLEIIEPTESH